MFWKKPAIIIVLITVLAILGLLLYGFSHEIMIRSQPVQSIHVVITGKRTIKSYSTARRGAREHPIPKCIVAFKFPDGSEKELEVKFEIFNDLQEGDTGTVSFQEHKKITKWPEEDRWAHRRFISFEKDS